MKLNSSLFNIPIVNNVLLYDTIDSTNNKAKELARRGSVHGSLVIAKSQTAGKGRLGRSFNSMSRDGLYFSIMLRPNVNPNHISSITLVTALAVAKAIDTIANVNTTIKWPNDIFLNDKKLVGILTEAGSDYVVIGIGINVNTELFNDEISHTATSVYKETGVKLLKEQLLEIILKNFNELYDQFIQNTDLSFMVKEYNKKLGSLGKEVFIIPQQRTLDCANPSELRTSDLTPLLCLGIDDHGNLKCEDQQGEIHYVNSGEVSLRNK